MLLRVRLGLSVSTGGFTVDSRLRTALTCWEVGNPPTTPPPPTSTLALMLTAHSFASVLSISGMYEYEIAAS